MKMLNIACGRRYHENWINIDFHTESKKIKKVNLLSGLPFDNKSFDVIYSSHFLEHLSSSQVRFVLKEFKRVLKTNGILRVVVPDLENLCREYLKILDNLEFNDSSVAKYNWITIELLDQLVRVEREGEMGKFFKKVANDKDLELSNYIFHRVGEELLVDNLNAKIQKITFDKIKNKIMYFYLKLVSQLIPKSLRESVFVNTSIGEKHRWMYDKYSLSKLLEDCGFRDILIQNYNISKIPEFNKYLLDIKSDGSPYKGASSLYVEAIK